MEYIHYTENALVCLPFFLMFGLPATSTQGWVNFEPMWKPLRPAPHLEFQSRNFGTTISGSKIWTPSKKNHKKNNNNNNNNNTIYISNSIWPPNTIEWAHESTWQKSRQNIPWLVFFLLLFCPVSDLVLDLHKVRTMMLCPKVVISNILSLGSPRLHVKDSSQRASLQYGGWGELKQKPLQLFNPDNHVLGQNIQTVCRLVAVN